MPIPQRLLSPNLARNHTSEAVSAKVCSTLADLGQSLRVGSGHRMIIHQSHPNPHPVPGRPSQVHNLCEPTQSRPRLYEIHILRPFSEMTPTHHNMAHARVSGRPLLECVTRQADLLSSANNTQPMSRSPGATHTL